MTKNGRKLLRNLKGEIALKDGTKNLSGIDLDRMQNNPSKSANDIGSQLPYHLQYIRDGKPIVKPEVKDESERNV